MKMISGFFYWIGNVIHNGIVHPILPFLPKKQADKLHDWSIRVFWPPYEESNLVHLNSKGNRE